MRRYRIINNDIYYLQAGGAPPSAPPSGFDNYLPDPNDLYHWINPQNTCQHRYLDVIQKGCCTSSDLKCVLFGIITYERCNTCESRVPVS